MSVPRRTNGNDPNFKTEESLVAESVFAAGSAVPEILSFLRREKVTGSLTVNVSKGGVTGVRFRQSQAVVVEE